MGLWPGTKVLFLIVLAGEGRAAAEKGTTTIAAMRHISFGVQPKEGEGCQLVVSGTWLPGQCNSNFHGGKRRCDMRGLTLSLFRGSVRGASRRSSTISSKLNFQATMVSARFQTSRSSGARRDRRRSTRLGWREIEWGYNGRWGDQRPTLFMIFLSGWRRREDTRREKGLTCGAQYRVSDRALDALEDPCAPSGSTHVGGSQDTPSPLFFFHAAGARPSREAVAPHVLFLFFLFLFLFPSFFSVFYTVFSSTPGQSCMYKNW